MITKRLTYRLFLLLTALFAAAITSCQQDEATPADGYGYIRFGEVSVVAEVEGETRAFSLPDVNENDFTVAFIKDGKTVESKTYGELSGTTQRLPQGEYTIKITYGVESTFSDTPYYYGESTATITAGETTNVNGIQVSIACSVVIAEIPTTTHFKDVKCIVECGDESVTLSNDGYKYILNNKEYSAYLEGTNGVGATVSSEPITINMEKPYRYTIKPNINFTLTLPDQSGGAWAKRFYVTPIQAKDGDGNLQNIPGVTYQIKLNGEWQDITGDDLCVTGLTSGGTEYEVRAVSGDVTSNTQKFKTETEVALPNGGMEEWTSETEPSYKVGWITYNYEWSMWYPRTTTDESSVEGWCTLNALTTSPGTIRAYQSNSGTVRTTTKNSGDYAAELTTLGWGNGNTAAGSGSVINNRTAAELFLGTIADYNNPTYLYTFEQRPNSIVFYAKYTPKSSSNKYSVTFEMYDENQELITSGTNVYEEGSIDSYSKREIELTYKTYYTKAKYMKLIFSSGSNTKDELDKGSVSNSATHTGNKLYIDDISLVYE